MELHFEPVWDWPWVILAAAVSLATVVVAYRRRIAHLGRVRRTLLLGLRIVSWAVLVFLMIRPYVEFTRIDRNATVFMILADASRSMTIKDAAGGLSRRDALLKLLDDNKKEFERLGKDIEIRLFDFHKELIAVDKFRPDAPGEQTAIGYVLDSLPREAAGKRIVGVLLPSDGAFRALSPHDTDPRAAASRLAEQQIPVHTIPFGASGLSENALDLIVEDLEVSPTVFVKNTVVVTAKIRALGAADRDLTVRLLVEEPLPAEPGKAGRMKLAAKPVQVRATRNQELLPVELSWVPQDPGEYKLTLEVDPLEGEPVTANNSLTTFISVLKGGISVAYFDRERPEMKYLRRIDESPDIRVDFKPIRQGPLGDRRPIESEWFEPGKYDVYIIGSVPAKAFSSDALKALEKHVEQGGGLLMTGGLQSFGPGGYGGTLLTRVMPIDMLPNEIQTGGAVDPSQHYNQPLQMLPTREGLQHFVMRLDVPERNQARWRALEPLSAANKFERNRLKPLAIELARSREDFPLLVAQDFGRGRSMAFAGDTTFVWYLSQAGHREEHQRFWQQVILWLAHKDVQGDEQVWVKLDARRFRIGQGVGMTMGARDAEKQPISDAEFKIEVSGPGDKKYTLTPQRSSGDMLARFLETQQPGEYKVRVEASRGGQSIGFGAEARFIVYEQDLELHNPAADPTLLEEIARITGGIHVAPEELGAHLRRLAQQGLNVEVTEIKRTQLWDNEWLILAFVALLTLEWFLRKRRGLV